MNTTPTPALRSAIEQALPRDGFNKHIIKWPHDYAETVDGILAALTPFLAPAPVEQAASPDMDEILRQETHLNAAGRAHLAERLKRHFQSLATENAPTSSPGETTWGEAEVRNGYSWPPPKAQSQTPMTEGLRNKCLSLSEHEAAEEYHSLCTTLETALAAAKEEIVRLARCIADDPHELVELRADRDALAEKLRELEERWAVREETLTRVLGERDGAHSQLRELEAGNKQALLDLDEAHTRLAALQQTVGEADKLLGRDTPWPVELLLKSLVVAEQRLRERGYDGDGWESLQTAASVAQDRLARQPDQRQGEGV